MTPITLTRCHWRRDSDITYTLTVSPQVALILDLIEDADYEGIRYDYSGRGMYGSTCLGVTTSSPAGVSGAIVAQASRRLADLDEAGLTLASLADLLAGASQDSMGLDAIIYWPRLKTEVTCTWDDEEDPDAPHTCSRCGMIENEDEHGQSVCEGCHQCSLCCGCGTFDDEEN